MNSPKASSATRQPLRRIAWEQIQEPGAYVELETGVLYRVPQEAIVDGASPRVERGGVEGSRPAGTQPPCHSQFVRVSANPDIFSLGARMICVKHDIQPRF